MSYEVGALPILNRLIERMRIPDFFREFLVEDKRCTISPVTRVLLLLKNYLVSREPVYGVAEWACRYRPDLLGIEGLEVSSVNDDRVARFVRETAVKVLGAEHVTSDQFTMTAEDMSEFLARVPGCFFFLGSANAEKGLNAPHHSPHFDIDEDVLPMGVAVLATAAAKYLSTGTTTN